MAAESSSPSVWVTPVTLLGNHIRLEPLNMNHTEGLFEAGSDPSIWQWLSVAQFKTIAECEIYIQSALKGGENEEALAFAVIENSTEAVVGTTRFLNIRPKDLALEIGWTWYTPRVQRTAVNTECKLLLMTHAFEVLQANRVQFKTDLRNLRSQAALARIGAVREGVLRKEVILPKDGYVRDSVYFSIIRDEWPDVKPRLLEMLQRNRNENYGNLL